MNHTDSQAEQVLVNTLSEAKALLGTRMIAAYALGSLAHGGFSPAVSDIDFALVLDDPFNDEDEDKIGQLHRILTNYSDPLYERVSIFWSTISGLTQGGEQIPGRFPPLDRLCLLTHGRLLTGQDLRSDFKRPNRDELTIAGGRFAVNALAERTRKAVQDPAHLLTTIGVRPTTKLILFPARFLFTADTGCEGTNDAAAEHYQQHHQGPAADLVAAGFQWRHHQPDSHASQLLAEGFCPLYQNYIDDYRARLLALHENDLAQQFTNWSKQFSL